MHKENNTNLDKLTVDGAEVRESEKIANALANEFESCHLTTLNMTSAVDNPVSKHIQWLDRQQVPDFSMNYLTSAEEIKFLVHKQKNKKAAGIDGIKPILLKKLSDFFYEFLANIFNWCITNGYFPSLFKIAKVIPRRINKVDASANSYNSLALQSVKILVFSMTN